MSPSEKKTSTVSLPRLNLRTPDFLPPVARRRISLRLIWERFPCILHSYILLSQRSSNDRRKPEGVGLFLSGSTFSSCPLRVSLSVLITARFLLILTICSNVDLI